MKSLGNKACFKCGTDKPLTEFYRHPRMSDGRLNKCKSCTKKDVSKNYRTRKPQYQAYEKDREARLERRFAKRRYGKRSVFYNHTKRKANWLVSNAIRDRRLIRKPCEVCGEQQSQAHHDDYSKPLEVRWLCFKHHREVHGQEVS